MTTVLPMEDVTSTTNSKTLKNGKEVEVMSSPGTGLNLNWYATKKTIAQGMLDIALLTANSAQLKHILLSQGTHQFYYPMLSCICISIALQILVGIGQLILVSLNINYLHRHKVADILNNAITSCVFMITVINVIISAFGIEGDAVNPARHLPPPTAAVAP